MEIKKTKIIGFCAGVRRAIKIAENSPNSFIAGGDIIHNPNETERLKKDFNIKSMNIDDIPNNSTTIISAHGIGLASELSMRNRNIKIVDTTCPRVKYVQNLANKLIQDGYNIFLFGNKDHPEVMGICGRVSQGIIVFKDFNELQTLNIPHKVALISQTTKPIPEFKLAEEFLKKTVKEFKSICTICPATQNNQNSVAELAKWADIMIVIGGKKSSNTKTLIITAEKFCNSVYQVENKSDLDKNWFDGKKYCGIAAGLSTPDYSINEIETEIKNLN